jgi:hypothetical protein
MPYPVGVRFAEHVVAVPVLTSVQLAPPGVKVTVPVGLTVVIVVPALSTAITVQTDGWPTKIVDGLQITAVIVGLLPTVRSDPPELDLCPESPG